MTNVARRNHEKAYLNRLTNWATTNILRIAFFESQLLSPVMLGVAGDLLADAPSVTISANSTVRRPEVSVIWLCTHTLATSFRLVVKSTQ